MTLFIGSEDGWTPAGAVSKVEFTPDETEEDLGSWEMPAGSGSFSASFTFDATDELRFFLFPNTLTRRARRRIRKRHKLEAHYRAKADRVPAWKRARS